MEDLGRVQGEVARRRAEVEAAREKADAETQRLVEAQARMKTAEDARAEAERERARLEAEINQQVAAQVQMLEDIRRSGQLEHDRVQEGIRLNTEREQQRLSELELMKNRAEIESAQRAEKERQILAQIDSLRIADTETRRRIEDAEVRRRATEDAYRLIAEKVQRVETEAHARAKEEERMLAKLEAERRTVAIEAQSRAEQEKRIREEIAMFRRLEDEQRPLIEKATLELADIENRLQERNARLREQEEARALGEDELTTIAESRSGFTEGSSEADALRDTTRPSVFPSTYQAAGPLPAGNAGSVDLDTDEPASVTVTPAIATYLKSVDPYKRAAAVAELARTGSADAFSRITDCFDDPSPHVRNAAARALRKLEPERTVDLFNRALETGSLSDATTLAQRSRPRA
jgi:chromosome segregation ATPase